jgi:hypothetical protein
MSQAVIVIVQLPQPGQTSTAPAPQVEVPTEDVKASEENKGMIFRGLDGAFAGVYGFAGKGIELADEAIKEAAKEAGTKAGVAAIEAEAMGKVLLPIGIATSAVSLGMELIAGEPPSKATIGAIAGFAGATAGEAIGTAFIGLAGVAVVPELAAAAIVGVFAAGITMGAAWLADKVYDYVESGQASANLSSVRTAVGTFLNDVESQVLNAVSAFPITDMSQFDLSTAAGQATFAQFLTNLETGIGNSVTAAFSALGITSANDPAITGITQQLSSVGNLYSAAAASTTGVATGQQTQQFTSYINSNIGSLPADAANAVGVSQASMTNTSTTLENGSVFTPTSKGTFTIKQPVTGSPMGATSTTSVYDQYGDITSNTTNYKNGTSEVTKLNAANQEVVSNWYSKASGQGSLIATTVESGDLATTTSFDGSGNVTSINVDDYLLETSTLTTISSSHIQTVTTYQQLDVSFQ